MQVNILPKLAAAPAPRTVVGILPQGPMFVGFGFNNLRMNEQVKFGRLLSLGHLELLAGLATTDGSSDHELIDSIHQCFNIDRDRLRRISANYRSMTGSGYVARDGWSPPAPSYGRGQSASSRPDLLSAHRLLVLRVPVLFNVGQSGFEHIDHWGRSVLAFTARELSALRHLTEPGNLEQLALRCAEGEESLSREELVSLLQRLLDVSMLRSFEPGDPDFELIYQQDAMGKRQAERITLALRKAIKKANELRPRRAGTIPVFPVNVDWSIAPLALGFLFSAARVYDGGRLNNAYDFRPDWLYDESEPVPTGPMLMLYSHYIWCSPQMLRIAARVKASNALALNIHGGPDVPKYTPDVERYFEQHPYVDVAVHGEGEVTICEILAALEADLLSGGPVDLSRLDSVAGLSYRGSDGRPVRTADRPRIESLDDIPSPFLTGEFDVFAEAGVPNVILETNRGCPYGCTFCDWGSATASRIRKFDLERVYSELEWCAHHHIASVALADANFGMYERDVEIARRTAELKVKHGYPRSFGTNYAKNSVKHLKPIVEILVEVDILAMGLLSLQSMDEDTLSTINRTNIKLSKYEALAAEFRTNKLPLYVDLMMGLPGSTVTSFRNDLQECIDREVYPKIHPTQLLVNSPMNEPSYRERHGITAAPSEMVVSCASFSQDDYAEMVVIRRIFLVAEKYGILRHALRYARHETGLREIDLLTRLMVAADRDGERWPALRFTFMYIPSLMVPPVDWCWFLSDIHRFFVEQLGIADDAALESALRAQHALLPAAERQFPETMELPCDYVAWYAEIVAAKERGHLRDWPKVVPPLRTYGKGQLTVSDPNRICDMALGRNFNSSVWSIWELESEVSRPFEGTLAV